MLFLQSLISFLFRSGDPLFHSVQRILVREIIIAVIHALLVIRSRAHKEQDFIRVSYKDSAVFVRFHLAVSRKDDFDLLRKMQPVFAMVRRCAGQGNRIPFSSDFCLCLGSRDAEIFCDAVFLVCRQADCHDIARIAHKILSVIVGLINRIIHSGNSRIQIQSADIIGIIARFI